MRQSIGERLGFLGLTLDRRRNDTNNRIISADDSRCGVHVVQTDEEQIIARHTRDLLHTGADLRSAE